MHRLMLHCQPTTPLSTLGFWVFFGSKTFSTKEAIVDLHSGALSIPHVGRQTCWQRATLSFTGLRHREGGVLVSY